ncbi:MAG: FGGY family carbohydrate kinase [Victivallaceae bacterium]|nr:FGGY family carbohydrate kinase [Victivallaceae bacterium]
MESHHIAIDLGAGSGRIIAGTRQGNEIRLTETARFTTELEQRNGFTCWNYAGLLEKLIDGLRITCDKLGKVPESISCDSWAQDFGLLDSGGALLSLPVYYRDRRTAGIPQHIAAIVPEKELRQRIGRSAVSDISTLAQLKFMAEYRREQLEQAAALLHMADLIHYELCGRAVSNWALASASQLMNVQTGSWDCGLLDKLDIPHGFLGKIASGKLVGYVNDPRFSRKLQGVPVISGIGHDTAAAFRAVDPGPETFFLSLGTWAMLGIRVNSFEQLPDEAIVMGVYPGVWTAFYGLPGMWIQQQCVQEWEKAGTFPGYAAFDAAVEASACNGIFDPLSPELFNPADMPGIIRELCAGNGSGVPVSIGDYGKVINRSLAECYGKAAARHNRKITNLTVTGGGLNNTPLLRELKTRFSLQIGPGEGTALGNIKAQIAALS